MEFFLNFFCVKLIIYYRKILLFQNYCLHLHHKTNKMTRFYAYYYCFFYFAKNKNGILCA